METTAPGQLRDLSPQECWELLTTTTVGRIAWTTTAGPEVVPVNFATDGTTVRIRTAAYSALAQKVDDEPVAFEVDAIEEATHAGWSVLVQGRASIRYRDEVDDGPTPEPWASGSRHTLIAIEVARITGRRLVPAGD